MVGPVIPFDGLELPLVDRVVADWAADPLEAVRCVQVVQNAREAEYLGYP